VKHKGLYIATIFFFLLVNTIFYWGINYGMFVISFVLLKLYFLILAVFLLGQTYFAVREKFEDRKRLILIGIMTVVLVLTILYPIGFINLRKPEKESIFIARAEGAASCVTTLKLRDDKTFTERSICFGVTETTGTYNVKGDTIFFENVSLGRNQSDFYKFAVIKCRETKGEKHLCDLVRYKDYSDTTGSPLSIIRNKLIKTSMERNTLNNAAILCG